ncbi:pilin [Vibrio maritimus]|uniref:pilin n=1 Tax=Vibrio maritimus TaxID=990268 RepID=UPI00373683B5
MNRANKQQGFTLIELMIVVAVIGVLAAVALPTYQNYIAKSETSSALATLSALRTPIETETLSNGQFPNPASAASYGIPQSYALGTITLTGNSGAAGTIRVSFETGKSSPKVAGNTLDLVRTAEGNWSCQAANIDSELLPKGCN